MVKIEIVEERDNHVTVLLKETDRALANALRRTLMTNVPKMAIHRVRFELGTIEDSQTGEIYESVGALPDEVIAHRLAMIPIPTFHDEFCFLEDDPGNEGLPREEWGTPASQIIYHCSARGTPEGHLVTAGDLNVLGEDKLQIPEIYRSIPITKLFTGQYLEFYAYAVLGVGADHAKWIQLGSAGWQAEVGPTYGAEDTVSIGGMPGFQGKLTEDEIYAVVVFERVVFGGGNTEEVLIDCGLIETEEEEEEVTTEAVSP